MISTNTTQPAPAVPGRSRVVTTNNLKPREFALTHRDYPGVVKLQTRKVTGKLTTDNLEERARIAKRAGCVRALKAAKARVEIDAAYDAETERSAHATMANEPEKKRAGRPKKQS